MHKRGVRHMRHMQKVREAIREQQKSRKGSTVVAGGWSNVKAGEGINEDLGSKIGAAKQAVQQKTHAVTQSVSKKVSQSKTGQKSAVKPSANPAVDKKLQELRKRTHANRLKAQKRGASAFHHGR